MEPPSHPPIAVSRREQALIKQKSETAKQPRQKLSRSDSKQRRLEKNRQSARESRKRKKTYIEALELRLESEKSQNLKLRTQNQNLRDRQKIAFLGNISQIDEFLSGRQELYEKLAQTVENGASQTEINTIIQCLKSRSGAYGLQRRDLINNLFKGIVELSFPQLFKYLFWGSSNNVGFFYSPHNDDDMSSRSSEKLT